MFYQIKTTLTLVFLSHILQDLFQIGNIYEATVAFDHIFYQ